MAVKGFKGKKQVKGKWNFLLMRPQGEVVNFAVSPLLLAAAVLFALVFAVCAVLAINQYFSLFLDYQALSESQREAQARLNKLDDQYQYQVSLTQDYAEILSDLDLPDPGAGADGDAPKGDSAEPEAAAGEAAPEPETPETPENPEAPPVLTADLQEEEPLAAWADRLPALAEQIEEKLQIADFKVEANRFSFQLVNESPGSLARGRLLTLFLVETGGRRQAVPFPDFDPRSPRPDFEQGLGYNIRSSKYFSGQLKVPAVSEILDMMVVAQSGDGRIVMKKRLRP